MTGSAAAPAASFEIGEALRFGWDRFKANIPTLAVIAIIVWGLQAITSWLARDTEGVGRALVQFLGFLVGQLIAMGWVRVSLALTDGQAITAEDLLPSADRFLAYALASILYALMVGVGLVLLIVPGVILAIVYAFYGFVIVDRGESTFAALRRSADLTRGHRGELFAFGLVLLGLNLLGALALGVGLLVTSPVSLIAVGYVYRRLAGPTVPAAS